jgi:hypothetical protein
MTRKQFLILLLVLLVLGAAGAALIWQDTSAYRASGARIGARLLPEFTIADVAELRLQDAKHQVTLVRKEHAWVVQERNGYTASLKEIGDFMIKLVELKVTQTEQVGAPLLPRLDLGEPGKGEGAGTLVEFKDGAGKVIARLILGKKVLKKDPLNPLPGAQDGVPAGRYVLPANAKGIVVVVSDPLTAADANPGRWLDKEFFKVERIKTLAAGPEGSGAQWKITRDEEWGQWKLAGGQGRLDASAAVGAVNALGNMSFRDVALQPASGGAGKPLVAVAETFDNLTYTIKLAKTGSGDDYQVSVSVAGSPPRQRVPEKDEKPEEKERRDKDFIASSKRLEERLAREKALAKWTYVVAEREVAPLLKQRGEMTLKLPPKTGKPGRE